MPVDARLEPYRLGWEDWRRLPERDGLCEVVGGELLVTPAPRVDHQRISARLGRWLANHLAATGAGELFHAPTAVRLGDFDVVQPDLVVVGGQDGSRRGELAIETRPTLVVEVLSPGTAQRDWGAKRALYAASGIAEYWIVDPIHRVVDVLRLTAGGEYETAATLGAGDTLTSPALPGLAVPLAEVFAPHSSK